MLGSVLGGISSFCKTHKRKILFLSIAAAVGYASYEALSTLNSEIDLIKKRLMGKDVLPDAPEELLLMKLEQLFVQAQLASDRTVLSLLSSIETKLNELVPRISAAELKEKIKQCKTTEEKAKMIQDKANSVLIHTGVCIYSIVCLALSLKTTYAVAAQLMVQSEQANEVAKDAEQSVTRITQRLLESENGIEKIVEKVSEAVEECMMDWPIRKACQKADYENLWRNMRQKLEDLSFNVDPNLIFSPGEAARRSLLSHCFAFSADGVQGEDAFNRHVEIALSKEATLDVLKSGLDKMFEEYFEQIAPQFNSEKALPLVRVVPLVQKETQNMLENSEANPYLNRSCLRNDEFKLFLQDVAGLRESGEPVTRHLLFVCKNNNFESVLAANLAKLHARDLNFQIFSSASSLDVGEEVVVRDDVTETLGMLGMDVSHHVPVGLRSIPKDIQFDVVVVLGELDTEQVESIPTKRMVRWNFSENSASLLREALDVRIRQLLTDL